MSVWRPITSDALQESLLGLVFFNIFINNIGVGIEYVFIKFSGDTKLKGAAGKAEGKDVIQSDLDKLERWIFVNLMRFRRPSAGFAHGLRQS